MSEFVSEYEREREREREREIERERERERLQMCAFWNVPIESVTSLWV